MYKHEIICLAQIIKYQVKNKNKCYSLLLFQTDNMTESLDSDGNILKRLNLNSELVINNNEIEECEAAEETLTTDSEEYLSMPMR